MMAVKEPKGMLKEFKEFALKGNMIDLAVGVMIGAAFGAVTNSIVSDLLTPLIGMITGGRDFSGLMIVLKEGKTPSPYATPAEAKLAEAVTLNYGAFLNILINFLIVAFVLFLIVKAFNAMRKKQEAEPVPDPEPTNEELLLTEIRDLLKANQG
jgi:large conductance mechanosensitive channel